MCNTEQQQEAIVEKLYGMLKDDPTTDLDQKLIILKQVKDRFHKDIVCKMEELKLQAEKYSDTINKFF